MWTGNTGIKQIQICGGIATEGATCYGIFECTVNDDASAVRYDYGASISISVINNILL